MVAHNQPAARFRNVKRKNLLYQAVREEIKNYILDNSLGPGDPLPSETELAQRLNIGRNSVREAVKSLEALGILEIHQGTGLLVREFSFDSILENLAYGGQFDVKQLSDILEVRHHIEYGMAERVIESVTPEQLQRLRALLREMETEALAGRYQAEQDRAFHLLLYENVDNSVVPKILEIFWAIYREAQERVSMPQPANPQDTYQRHAEIVQALAAGDVEALRGALRAHRPGIQARVRALAEAQLRRPAYPGGPA